MPNPTLGQRLLRIQMLLERHDEHHPDCLCDFCEAISRLSVLRRELRQQERAA